MATTQHTGVIPGAEAKKLYSYPTLPASDSAKATKYLSGAGTWTIPYTHPALEGGTNDFFLEKALEPGGVDPNVTRQSYINDIVEATKEGAQKIGLTETEALQETFNFGMTIFIPAPIFDKNGHYCGYEEIAAATLPAWEAQTNMRGLMSAADKTKLDGIATGANKYVHPTMAAATGQPTANQTPAFGATFNINQVNRDTNGHVSAINTRTVKIPNTAASASTDGLMSKATFASLTSALARIASLESILTTAGTASINANGGVTLIYSNGKTAFTLDKAGEY